MQPGSLQVLTIGKSVIANNVSMKGAKQSEEGLGVKISAIIMLWHIDNMEKRGNHHPNFLINKLIWKNQAQSVQGAKPKTFTELLP